MTDQSSQLSNFDAWLSTPRGQYLSEWEQPILDKAVDDIFGYNSLQLGLPSLQGLNNSRIPNRWLVLDQPIGTAQHTEPPSSEQARTPHLITHFDALPFTDQSIDLVILPHTLDLSANPHATLREVVRVLVPEGKIVITGINPSSLWGLLQRRVNFARRLGENAQFLPLGQGSLIGYRRLRDWLQLLNLEIYTGGFGCYRPAFKKTKWLEKSKWMEAAGDRWWPIFGATYQVTVVKRIQSVRLIGANWKPATKTRATTAGAHKNISNKDQSSAKQ